MEAAAGAPTAARGVSLPMPSPQSSRKEWRAVSEHSVVSSGNEEVKRSKLGQSDERLIYEVQHRREPAGVEFCSITIAGNLDDDVPRQRLHSVMKQRGELQQMEIELRAQLIAKSEVREMQNTYDTRIKEHENANSKLHDQLREREQTIHELERTMEDKERELHAIRLANEAVWAKEDLLREQNKELATFRRDRDNSEAERAQHLKQIREFLEHIQEKERQFLDLQEQHRVAQETIIFKDDQMREVQAWINRAQDMDALQSSTNQSLQAELRERIDQYNQLWVGCQRQFAEMERLHMLQLQQLRHELAEARKISGNCCDVSHASQNNSKDVSHFEQSNGSQLEAIASSVPDGNSGNLSNDNVENFPSFISSVNGSVQTEHVPGVPMAPSYLVGLPTYLPPGQVTALPPFLMHQQRVSHSVSSQVPQSHVAHFQSVPSISSSLQHWENQQALLDGSLMPTQILLRSDTKYDCDVSVIEQTLPTDYLNAHMSQETKSHPVVPSSNVEGQEKSGKPLANHGLESEGLILEQSNTAADMFEVTPHPVNFGETTLHSSTGAVVPEPCIVPIEHKNAAVVVDKTIETALLDERSLLACIVRTIPPVSGGRIRISSTLPNRLCKMLTPLHWHDYQRKFGKLNEFVANHPELFVIEGDYIQLREGAQEIIAATAAVAKVAAAAAAVTSHSVLLPSVAVTPMAQQHRPKKVLHIDSTMVKDDKFIVNGAPRSGNATDIHLQSLIMQNQHSNGVSCSLSSGATTVKVLSKPKHHEFNGTESRSGQSSVALIFNGANSDRCELGSSQSNGSIQGRPNANFVGTLLARSTGAALGSRR